MISSPTPPNPPNPNQVANAQSGMNTDTAIAQMMANHTNQITPWGSMTYDKTGSDSFVNSRGKTVTMPTYTMTQNLSPQEQAIQAQQMAAQLKMSGVANQEIGRVGDVLSQGISYAGAPAAPTVNWGAPQLQGVGGAGAGMQMGVGPTGNIQGNIANGGNVQMNVNSKDATAARADVTNALIQRMQPQLQAQQKQMQASLAAQGITPGSEAYNNAMRAQGSSTNDLMLGAMGQGAQEAQAVAAQDLAAGQFHNSAVQQSLGQNLAQGQFHDAAQQQQYLQALQKAGFINSSQAQQYQQQMQQTAFNNSTQQQNFGNKGALFSLGQAARNNWIQEYLTKRQTPINEIGALMSGSQVQNPQFANLPVTPVANTDYAQIVQNTFQDKMGIYNSQLQQSNAAMGGIFGLGSSLLGGMASGGTGFFSPGGIFSDPRLKTNVELVGHEAGLPVYRWSYGVTTPLSAEHIGPMADDVAALYPDAVTTHASGFRQIDLSKITRH